MIPSLPLIKCVIPILFIGLTMVHCSTTTPPPPVPDSGSGNSESDGGAGSGSGNSNNSGNTSGQVDGGTGSPPDLIDEDPNDSWGAGEETECIGPNARPSCVDDNDCTSPLDTCVPGGCAGEGFCTRKGRACTGMGDCPAQASCFMDGGDGVCVSSNGFCEDSRTCPTDWSCEGSPGSRFCQDRRLPCQTHEHCPSGFACHLQEGAGHRYCKLLQVECDLMNPTCLVAPFTRCVDLNGSGNGVCFPAQGCSSHTECSSQRCATEASVNAISSTCQRFGECLGSGDCNTALSDTCVDRHFSGRLICTPPGHCLSDSNCPDHSRCFDRDSDGDTECVCFDPTTNQTEECG